MACKNCGIEFLYPRPDSSTAPEWANFLAQNPDGKWSWFEAKPELDYGLGWMAQPGTREHLAVGQGWETSLAARKRKP